MKIDPNNPNNKQPRPMPDDSNRAEIKPNPPLNLGEFQEQKQESLDRVTATQIATTGVSQSSNNDVSTGLDSPNPAEEYNRTAASDYDEAAAQRDRSHELFVSGNAFKEKRGISLTPGRKLREILSEAGLDSPANFSYRDNSGKVVGLDRVINEPLELFSLKK